MSVSYVEEVEVARTIRVGIAVAGEVDEDQIVAGRALEEAAQRPHDPGGGGLLVDQQLDVVAREAPACGGLQERVERLGVAVGVAEVQPPVAVARDADQEGPAVRVHCPAGGA